MAIASFFFGLFVIVNTISSYLKYEVFTQTKIIQATSSPMPSVTFCIYDLDTKDLNSFFDKAEFSSEQLSSEQFNDESFENCIKFNHFINQSDTKLFIALSLNDSFQFEIEGTL